MRVKPHHRLYLAALLLDCALMAGATAVPFFIFDRLGGGAGMSGAIAAMHSLFYAALSLLSARFVTRAGNGMKWAYAGTIQYGLLYSASALTSNVYLFAAASTLGFMGLALVWPAQWSWLGAEPEPAIRMRRISHYNVSWSVGLMAGPPLAGLLYAADYRLPFLFVFLISAVALWLQTTLPREAVAHAAPTPVDAATAGARRATQGFLYAAWFANFVGWIILASSRSVFPKRVADLAAAGDLAWLSNAAGQSAFLAQGALAFSWLSFTINAARLVVFALMGFTHRWQGRISLIVLSQVIAAAACWVLAWTQSYVIMLLCCAGIGICGGVCFFFSAFYSLAEVGKKHQRAAVNEAMVGAGSFTGAISFGLLASHYGVSMPFRWTPIMMLAAVALQYALFAYGMRRARNRPF